MPDFGDAVGIRFIEAMSGYVQGDPASRAPGDRPGWLKYDLQISIPSLRAFLDADEHAAEVEGGTISWNPFVDQVAVHPGRMVLFRAQENTRRRKFFDLDFTFPVPQGFDVIARGHKILFNDTGFDCAGDLSTIHLTLSTQHSPIASGIVTVHPAEFVRQLDTLVVSGASSADEERAAREAFFAFMNRELRDVYPGMPLLLKEEGRLTLEERRTLELCIRCMLPDPLPAGGAQMDDILETLERTLASTKSPEADEMRNWVHAVGLIVPIIASDVGAVRRFIADALKSNALTPVRDVMTMIHSLVVLPYYSHPKTDALVGYDRPRHRPHNTPTLPVSEDPPDREFDVAIAGSGPAGCLLAARLAEAGRSVILLEAGPYVPEKSMSTDEMEGLTRLYKNSGLQRSNQPEHIFDQPGPSFFVLQGRCVGGGGVINNAVCFQMSNHRLAQWTAVGFPLPEATLRAAYATVANELPIVPLSEATHHLNPTGAVLEAALGKPRKPSVVDPPEAGFYECLVNLEPLDPDDPEAGCIGAGLCNVACASERKRNGLQVHLPRAAAAGCVIVPDARVAGVRMAAGNGGARKVAGLDVALASGRRMTVRAKEFVLSCGPVGSTEVLLRSKDLEDHIERNRLPVGARFSANIGSPLFGFTPTPVHSRPSVQIAHYIMPPGADDGYIVESWFNPPGANALAMPGFMTEHFDRMSRYTSQIAAAPLVGTRPRGRIRLRNGRIDIRLPIDGQEIDSLATGLELLGKAMLDGGVDHAIAGFEGGRRLETDADVEKLRADLLRIRDNREKLHLLQVGTGHPQGGNALSEDPDIGVIDGRFRVRGITNLRICDGSVFPDASGVNPQWTIMALAECCAADMLA
jgi:choline dehydrogenase-like flavoprotein